MVTEVPAREMWTWASKQLRCDAALKVRSSAVDHLLGLRLILQ